MDNVDLTEDIKRKILGIQRNEITEHVIYKKLGLMLKDKANGELLEKISQDELAHYEFWRSLTGVSVAPDKLKIFYYMLVNRIFGITFGLKIMESGEGSAQEVYATLRDISPRVAQIIADEDMHENQLVGMIDEERLKYASSVVLGLNDALVELTGALVGFTLALQNTRMVGIVGLITGIAASMSMSASEYLSTRQEDTDKDPVKASIYTGVVYIGTVCILVAPYFMLQSVFLCMALVIINAILLVLVFTFYISVAKGLDFKKRFFEMAGISLGIACINFIIGLAIRKIFGIQV